MKEAIEKFNTDKPWAEFTLGIAGNEEVKIMINKWEGFSGRTYTYDMKSKSKRSR